MPPSASLFPAQAVAGGPVGQAVLAHSLENRRCRRSRGGGHQDGFQLGAAMQKSARLAMPNIHGWVNSYSKYQPSPSCASSQWPHRLVHCAFVGRKEKTRYSLDGVAPWRQASRRSRNRPWVVARAHSDWELVVVAQELLYRLADMSLIRWLACLIRFD